MQSTLTPREASYRTGYLITLAGLTITLGTVYIWSATSVFVCIYIGAGAWFYMRGRGGGHREAAARPGPRRAGPHFGPAPARFGPRAQPGR